jgi:hypothetical protein
LNDIKEALELMVEDIKRNNMVVVKTRGGTPAIIFTRESGGENPLLGAYYTGIEWIPVKWTIEGKFPSVNESAPHSGLDIDIVTKKEA